MDTKRIYCSACDRDVTIAVADGDKDFKLEGAVCLDIGATCTGTLCPICAVAPETMRERGSPGAAPTIPRLPDVI
jgi:hypothetical protein